MNEVKEKWGDTAAYAEYEKKSAGYGDDKFADLSAQMMKIFDRFAWCRRNHAIPESDEAQMLVQELQDFISENYYICTDEILAGLGKMYVCDERFKKSIDVSGEGTAEFVSRAIEYKSRSVDTP